MSGSNNEKGNDGMNELLGSTKFSRAMTMRSEDDVFSDAAAEFSDTGVKDRLQQQDSLDSGTDVERINKKEQTHSDYSEYKDCSGKKMGFTSLPPFIKISMALNVFLHDVWILSWMVAVFCKIVN